MSDSSFESKYIAPTCQPPDTLSYTFWLDGKPVYLDYENFNHDGLWKVLGMVLNHHEVQQHRAHDLLCRLGNEIADLKDENAKLRRECAERDALLDMFVPPWRA